jgi:pimeloyl-ACP methyl ester carboxylesterase
MASGETLPRGGGRSPGTGHSPGPSKDPSKDETVTGVVVVAHGGQSSSTESTTAIQPAVLRMIPVASAIRKALRGSGAVVVRPRFELRGWNGGQASPVDDLNRALDGIAVAYGPVPVVLIGHSMGARAAMRAAGHPAVAAVAGLAPWLPLGEPVEQLAGRWILLAHGTADGITSPAETWAFVERARAVTQVAAVEVRDGDHPMLRRARLWHAIAAEFARAALDLPAGRGASAAAAISVAAAIAMTSSEPPRTIV